MNFSPIPVSLGVFRGPRPMQPEDFDAVAAVTKYTLDLESGFYELVHGEIGQDAREWRLRDEALISFPLCPLWAPKLEKLHSCVETIQKYRSQGGIFVHCQHGHERTGIVIAAFRHWAEGWSVEKARSEALWYGFHPEFLSWFAHLEVVF